jgi:DNA-binding IclR family transcriptional regulator
MLTLTRGLQIIRAFGERRCPQTAAELSRRAGLPRAVTQRCLYTLSLLGFVSKHERRYVLTPPDSQFGPRLLCFDALRFLGATRARRTQCND